MTFGLPNSARAVSANDRTLARTAASLLAFFCLAAKLFLEPPRKDFTLKPWPEPSKVELRAEALKGATTTGEVPDTFGATLFWEWAVAERSPATTTDSSAFFSIGYS